MDLARRFTRMMKNHWKPIISCVVVGLVLILVPRLVFGQSITQAITDPVDFFIISIAWLVYGVAWLGGQLLLGLVVILVWVASYNGFIDEPIVNVGWTIIRDLCNMAFIIALLYMAFNMVFGLKGKGGSLLTLIINAGLINFSKAISGFMIDISQVVMLTFVHGFYKIAGGNILEGLGFTSWFTAANLGGAIDRGNTLTPAGSGAASTLTILITILVALIMIYIAVGIILTFIIVLIGRIFKLWGLLITSPIPFVKKILPGIPNIGSGGDYWSELSKTAAAGPILAFWLWLVFTAVTLYNGQFADKIFKTPPTGPTSIAQGGTLSGQAAGFSEAGSISNILGFMIFIGMLLLALKASQDQAQAMGSFVGKAASKIRGGAHKWTMKGAKGLGRQVSEHGGRPLGYVASKFGFDRTAKILNAGVAGNYRAVKDLVKDKGHIMGIPLSKEKREQRRKLRERDAKEGWYEAHADYIQKKPGTKYSFRTDELLSQSSGEAKKLDDQNLLQSQGKAQFQFDEAIRIGNEAKAVGIAVHMAEKGWGSPNIMMKKIQERFGTSGEAKKLILRQMESKAGKAEGANKFFAPAISSVREDFDTGDLSEVDVKGRVADAKDFIQRGTFDEVDEAVSSDRRSFNFTNIADDKEEVEARVGVIGEWAKKVQETASELDGNDRLRNRWLQRWGSKDRREQIAGQLQTLVGIAKKNGVDVAPEYKEAIEGVTRLMMLKKEEYSYDVRIAANRKETRYNFNATMSSARSGSSFLNIDKYDNAKESYVDPKTMDFVCDLAGNELQFDTSPGIVGNLNDQVFNQAVIPVNLPGIALTSDAQKQTNKFVTGLLTREEKFMRSADDRPKENDQEVDRILRLQRQASDSTTANLQTQLNVLQSLQDELTNRVEKDKPTFEALQNRLRDVRDNIRGILAGQATRLVNPNDGTAVLAETAFDNSNLRERMNVLDGVLQGAIDKTDPASAAYTGPEYTIQNKEASNVNSLLGGTITAVNRTLFEEQEKEFRKNRKRVKGNRILEYSLDSADRARKTAVRENRIEFLTRAREHVYSGLRALSRKYENDPRFLAVKDSLRSYLGGLDFEGNPDHIKDGKIDEMTQEIARALNKYVK